MTDASYLLSLITIIFKQNFTLETRQLGWHLGHLPPPTPPLFNMHQRNHARALTVILSPTLPVFTSTYDGRSNSD